MDIIPIKCCPGFFFSSKKQVVCHDIFGAYIDYYNKDEIIRNVKISLQDGDSFSYTPLYIMSEAAFDVDTLIGYRFTGVCYSIRDGVASFYSPVLHRSDVRLELDAKARDIFIGGVYELEVEYVLSGRTSVLYVRWLRKVHAFKTDTDPRTKEKSFYIEVKVLREPIILAFNEYCGAVGMGESTHNKVPGLQQYFPAIVGFRPVPCTYQLRPYIKRMARQGDERMYEFEDRA